MPGSPLSSFLGKGKPAGIDRRIADSLPNPTIIPKPGKVAGMIWIVKHFQTLLMSALIAVIIASHLQFKTLLVKPGQAANGGSGLQPSAYDPTVLCLG